LGVDRVLVELDYLSEAPRTTSISILVVMVVLSRKAAKDLLPTMIIISGRY